MEQLMIDADLAQIDEFVIIPLGDGPRTGRLS